jgi:hypothetical protein
MRAVREPVAEETAERRGKRIRDTEGIEAFAMRALFECG